MTRNAITPEQINTNNDVKQKKATDKTMRVGMTLGENLYQFVTGKSPQASTGEMVNSDTMD